jgi:hypothetical protein
MNQYRPGDTITLTTNITLAGVPVNPSTVTLTIQPAGGGTQIVETVSPSTIVGTYSYDYTLASSPPATQGVWRYRYTASGSTGGSGTGQFLIGAPTF